MKVIDVTKTRIIKTYYNKDVYHATLKHSRLSNQTVNTDRSRENYKPIGFLRNDKP